jgi:tetratricopeptide (TPR) repeat protein
VGQPAEATLRHLAFFEALVGADEGSAEWRAMTAGLVVLRLLDAWIDDGPTVAATDSWGLRAARETVAAIDAGDPARTILGGVLDAMAATPAVDVGTVAPRLMAYGRALDFRGLWALAADVYGTVVAHAHPLEDPDIAIDANMRLAYCARMNGDWTTAATGYGRAGEIAAATGDIMGVLRARVGDAKLAMARGNLPQAEAILDETIERAGAERLPQLRSMALHDSATVAHRRGDFERAIRLAYEALESSPNPAERDRVLADIASFFADLGVRSAARDAHLVLAATAQEQYTRWTSLTNLMEYAALDRCEPVFEQYRRELADASLPVSLEATYHLYVGRGYLTFDRSDAARAALSRAIEIGSRVGLNQIVFEAEQSLRDLEAGERTRARATVAAPESLREIATAIGAMRMTVGSS